MRCFEAHTGCYSLVVIVVSSIIMVAPLSLYLCAISMAVSLMGIVVFEGSYSIYHRKTRGQGGSVLKALPSYPLGSEEYHLSPFLKDFTPKFCLAIFSVLLEISSSFAWFVISSELSSPSARISFSRFSA